VIAGDAQRARIDDARERDDGDVGGAAAAIHQAIVRAGGLNANVFRNGGSPYSLVLSIPQRGQSQKPMTWCPL
jgi:hypothetical protein